MDYKSYKVVKSAFNYNQIVTQNEIDPIPLFKVKAVKLLLSSGKIVIRDPFFFCDRSPLDRTVAAGKYPVTLIWIDHPTAEKRVAFAQLILNPNMVNSWELTLVCDEDIDVLQDIQSGNGCLI
jgi:hypothetical protein